jgi:hypothetical protein
MGGDYSMSGAGSNKFTLTGLRDPASDLECAHKKYVDETFVRDGHEATIKGYKLNQFAKPDDDLDCDDNKIKNVSQPTNDKDASNKKYVDDADNVLQG